MATLSRVPRRRRTFGNLFLSFSPTSLFGGRSVAGDANASVGVRPIRLRFQTYQPTSLHSLVVRIAILGHRLGVLATVVEVEMRWKCPQTNVNVRKWSHGRVEDI